MKPISQASAKKILLSVLERNGAKPAPEITMRSDGSIKAVVRWRRPPRDWMTYQDRVEEMLGRRLGRASWRVLGTSPEYGKFEIGPVYDYPEEPKGWWALFIETLTS